ncbi:hypothetical protein [Bacillus thermotolerans]|uniref:Uncharacterized protein n=1 Tax=Bacillus thermotolerans TaxID=1221996 RepID=A0A0F5HTI5_BACTR|nr:hypothetical protein [Bacillus thermotolerans]KKB36694.1 hypothetical protein QY95_02962 [Bacillus thermotolerans]
MERNVYTSEKILLFGYSLVLSFMVLQDAVPLGPFNDIEAVALERSTAELVVVTMIGVMQILLLMGIILLFIGRRYPIWAQLWLLIHPSCILAGAMISWWIPYLFGIGAEEKAASYEAMFGNTHSFLPVMNGIVPNTLHTVFHFILLLCILLTFYIFIVENKREKRLYKKAKEQRERA